MSEEINISGWWCKGYRHFCDKVQYDACINRDDNRYKCQKVTLVNIEQLSDLTNQLKQCKEDNRQHRLIRKEQTDQIDQLTKERDELKEENELLKKRARYCVCKADVIEGSSLREDA